MARFAIGLLLCLLPAVAPPLCGQAPRGDTLPDSDFAVRCGLLLVGDGTAIPDAWLVVRGGRIAAIGTDRPAADLPVLDASTRVVMPGIVAADSDLSGAGDSDYNVTPDAMAVDGFDFARSWSSALQGGVTTAYLSPGRERLVSGQGAVVKLAGRDVVQRVLADANCLRANLGDGAITAPRVFEPVPHPTSDEPLEAARIQTPTARISILNELRGIFAAAIAAPDQLLGQGPVENRYSATALVAAAQGKLPLRVAAQRAQDIRRALQLQQELGLRLILEDPQELGSLAAKAKAQGAMATFRMPVLLGMANPGGEDRRQKAPPARLDAPAVAVAAGLTIALAPARGMPLRDYLLAPGLAIRHGLSPAAALRAVTLDAARVLSVDQRVGSLAVGKDADFLVLSGEPFAVGTLVEATYIDGRPVWQRRSGNASLAVRCGRIVDGEGRVFRNGTILVHSGRIKAVGEDLALPYGAQAIHIPDGVMVPGLIDAYSHLGLAGDGTGVPPGQPNQQLHLAVQFDDPMFAPALAEGLTTVLVAGKDGAPVAGRIAALKTGARDPQRMVVASIAGQRTSHDAIGPDAIKPLRDLLDRGKKYTDTWRQYDKALAEWKAGKRPAKPAEPPPQAAAAAAAPAEDPVSGVWEATLSIQGRIEIKVALDLKLAGAAVTGTIRLSLAGRESPAQEIRNGTFGNGTLKFEFSSQSTTATFEGTIADDTLTGKLALGPLGAQDVTAKRTSKATGSAPPAAPSATPTAEPASDEPKAPPVDEGLEPLRAVFEQRGALVVRTTRGQAIGDVVDLLDKEKIAYVLHGADDALDDPGVLRGKKPPVLLEPDVVRDEDGGRLRNAAAAFVDLDLPVLLGSAECANARLLPLHAAYAVRYGLAPTDALAALTANTAKAFKLDDRIGSLRRGKDADFVVFSGDPFEPGSRVLLVVCDGEIVVDRREVAR